MTQAILYPLETGGVAVVIPAPEYADQIEAVAEKDVPAGLPWRVVNLADLPSYDTRARWLWTVDGPLTIGPPPPEPVPHSLSFAQMLIGLVSEGWISAAEGRAWRDRVALPAPVVALIAAMPEQARFAAETRAFAPSEVLRADPLVVALGAMVGKTPEEIDQFFRAYANVS